MARFAIPTEAAQGLTGEEVVRLSMVAMVAGIAGLFWAVGAVEDRFLLVLALVLAMLVAADRVLFVLTDRRRFDFLALFGRSTALAYLGGAAPAQIGMLAAESAPNRYLAARGAILDVAPIAEAAVYVSLFWLALEVLSFVIGSGAGRWLDRLCRDAEDDPHRAYNAMGPFLLIGGIFYVTLIVADMLALSTLTLAADDPSRSLISNLAGGLWPLLAILCGASAGLRDGVVRVLPFVVFVLLLVVSFALGRRVFMMAAVLALLGYAWMRDLRPGPIARWAALLVALPLAGLVVDYFLDLRTAIEIVSQQKRDYTFWDLVAAQQQYALASDVAQKTISRSYIIGYLAQLIEQLRPGMELGGEGVLRSALMAIPSAFWADKTAELAVQDEIAVAYRTGVMVSDEAWSLAVGGFADFRWLGVLTMPLLIGAYGAGLRVIGFITRNSAVGLALIAFMFAAAASVEMAAATALSYARLALMVALAVGALEFVTGDGRNRVLILRKRA